MRRMIISGSFPPGASIPAKTSWPGRKETGYTASSWRRALKFYASPGFLDETMAIYLARGLRKGKAQPEEDEVIKARLWPLRSALRMVSRHVIRDGKTITGLLWFSDLKKREKAR
jgi:ADP-ribose pyrophosphatase